MAFRRFVVGAVGAVFTLTVVSASRALASEGETEWSDSGVKGPKYDQILEQMSRLEDEYRSLAKVVEYGKSLRGKPLRLLLVQKPTTSKVRPTLLMTGSTHGNEYLNIEDRLPEELLKRAKHNTDVARFLDAGGALVFVPVVNPDGYDARRRGNAKGVDLNRDWDLKAAGYKGFKQPETKALADQLESLTKTNALSYKITVDYHCCIGALLHPWSYTRKPISEYDRSKHAEIGELANKWLDIAVGNTNDVLGYYATGTTKDYYYEKYGALAFTYEGRFRTEREYFSKHVSWWESLASHLTKAKLRPFLTLFPNEKKTVALQKFAD